MGDVTAAEHWASPTPGDIWALTITDTTLPFRFNGTHYLPANYDSPAVLTPTSPIITAGDRLWPRSRS